MDCRDASPMIHAHLDGELDAASALSLEKHFEECAACRGAYQRELELSSAIRLGAQRHAAPELLKARIAKALHQEAPRRSGFADLRLLARGWNPAAIAASLLIAVIGSATLTDLQLRADRPDPIVQEVVASHIRSLMADHLTDVLSSDSHTVKPWFNGKLDVAPPAPDLVGDGYPLVGGRLDYLAGRPVAALVYRHNGHVINVFAVPAGTPAAVPASAAYHGYTLLHRDAAGLSLWIVSDLNTTDLGAFANLLAKADENEPAAVH